MVGPGRPGLAGAGRRQQHHQLTTTSSRLESLPSVSLCYDSGPNRSLLHNDGVSASLLPPSVPRHRHQPLLCGATSARRVPAAVSSRPLQPTLPTDPHQPTLLLLRQPQAGLPPSASRQPRLAASAEHPGQCTRNTASSPLVRLVL